MLGLILSEATAVLDRRLASEGAAPIAVAFSGGGDSLAALHLTQAWAARHGRRVLALSVDHGLRPQGAEWVAFAGRVAERLGARFQALRWEGPRPDHGWPAAARLARHRLIADAARGAGARVVVFGHTADDRYEAALMRADGLRLGDPSEWSPSPVWPEGRGLFLLRPLLSVRRAAIREALRNAGETWIDDPANDDPASPRVRARRRLADGALAPGGLEGSFGDLAELAASAAHPGEAFLRIDRQRLRDSPAAAARRLIGIAALSHGGGDRPPRRESLERLADLAVGPDLFQATLAGAKVVGLAEEVLVAPDAGAARRRGASPVPLPVGVPTVWSGRYAFTALRDGLSVHALEGCAARLDPAQRQRLKALPAAARPGLPMVFDNGAAPVCPILAEGETVRMETLVHPRFLAACGAISKEPAT